MGMMQPYYFVAQPLKSTTATNNSCDCQWDFWSRILVHMVRKLLQLSQAWSGMFQFFQQM